MRRCLMLQFILLAGMYAYAQDAASWQLRAKLFAGYANVKDEVFSKLNYTGWSAGAGAAVRFEKGRSLHEWEVAFSKGNLEHENNGAQQTYITGDYTYLYSLREQADINYDVGGSINILYAKRSYDDFINYNVSNELITSLSVVGAMSVSLGNGFSVYDRLQLPLVSMVMQPSVYDENAPGKTGSGLKDFFKSSRLASFRSFLRIKNNLILEKEIGLRQSISFAYSWDFYRVRDQIGIRQANHQLGITYNYTF